MIGGRGVGLPGQVFGVQLNSGLDFVGFELAGMDRLEGQVGLGHFETESAGWGEGDHVVRSGLAGLPEPLVDALLGVN